MKKKIEFETSLLEKDIMKSTKTYFLSQGFKLEQESIDKLIFKKGSLLFNMITFNPLTWKSIITITFNPKTITGDFDIDTTGQTVTPKEEQLWENFIQNYKRFLLTNLDYTTENKQHLRSTYKSNLNYIKPAIMGAVIVGIPAGILAYFTGINSLVSVGAAGGAISFVMNKIEKKKKKNTI